MVEVPRGEPRQLLAAVADTLAARASAGELRDRLDEAAAAVLPDDPARDEQLARAVAYRLDTSPPDGIYFTIRTPFIPAAAWLGSVQR